MNIMSFNNNDLACVQGLGEFLDQTLNICLTNADSFVNNLPIQKSNIDDDDDRFYNNEDIKPRVKL
jgi:hypothetical protein